jgi:Flp pilus assembly protein TadD
VADRNTAVELFRKAVDIDPAYGLAWAQMARVLSLSAFQDSNTAMNLTPAIRLAARRAMELEGRSTDASLALARLAWIRDWNWPEAERRFRTALEIAPSDAAAHQSYALALMSRRRFREACFHSVRATELNPLSFAASNDLGVVLYAARRFPEAEAHIRKARALTPHSPYPAFLEGSISATQGRLADAIRDLETAAAALNRAPEILGRLGNAYARAGRSAEAGGILAEMQHRPAGNAIYEAMVEAGLGHTGRALALLEQSADHRETDFVFLAVDPVFDALRPDPGFARLCSRLGLAAK